MVQNKSIVFNKIPIGEPVLGETLNVVTEDFNVDQELAEGSAIVKVITLSVDPYQRARMREPHIESYVPAFPLGKAIDNFGAGRVIKSKNTALKEGAIVCGFLPFTEYTVIPAEAAPAYKDISAFVGSGLSVENMCDGCGIPGMTAYMSFFAIGKPKKGESILVSTAAGAVGGLVVQLAKQAGLRVLASTGTDEKVEIAKSLGADHAFNYKKSGTGEEIKKFGGIDIFYDNVGGEMLETVLDNINTDGRIIVCGAISQYNNPTPYGIKNVFHMFTKRLSMQGFILLHLMAQPSSHPDFAGKTLEEEFIAIVPKLILEGKLKIREQVYSGLDKAPQALLDLFRGDNTGKVVVKLE